MLVSRGVAMTDYIVPATAGGYALWTLAGLHTMLGVVCYILFLVILLGFMGRTLWKCHKRWKRAKDVNIRRRVQHGRRIDDIASTIHP